MIPSPNALAEYGEQVSGFLRRAKSKAEGATALQDYSGSLLAQLPALLPAIQDSSAYAGMAFYGRFKAIKLPLIRKVTASDVKPQAALEAIRDAKALQVAASAKAGWDLLWRENPEALLDAIYMNLCLAPISVRISKIEPENQDPEAEVNEDEDDDDETTESDDDDAE